MNDGSEVMFFGSSDGVVYQMDKGTSFDGDEIERYAHFAFNFSGSPRGRKRYKHAEFEIQGEGYAEFNVRTELSYNSSAITQDSAVTTITELSSGVWDSGVWDALFWDGRTLVPSDVSIGGTGTNISVIIQSLSDYFYAITFSAVILDYSERRRSR
jgi:hypothetical protein